MNGLSQSFETIRNANAWNFRNDVLEEPFYPDFFVNHAHIQTDETVSLDSGIIDELITMEDLEEKPDDQYHINGDVSTPRKEPFFISRHTERLKNNLSIEDMETVTDSKVMNENQSPYEPPSCIIKEVHSNQKNEEPISDDDKDISCSEHYDSPIESKMVSMKEESKKGKLKFRSSVQKLIDIQRNIKLLNMLKNGKEASAELSVSNEDEKKIADVDVESIPTKDENEKNEEDTVSENVEIMPEVNPSVTENMTENEIIPTTEAIGNIQL